MTVAAAGVRRRSFLLLLPARARTTAHSPPSPQLYLYSRSPVRLDAPGRLPVVERRKGARTISAAEVAKHNSRESLWMCIEDEVWECVPPPLFLLVTRRMS